MTSHYGLQEDIYVDDFITSYLLKTCLMNLLPLHSKPEKCKCNCNDRLAWVYKPTTECRWPAVERDSACGWAISIYEKLKTDLEAKVIHTWYDRDDLGNCYNCEVERGCCKKRKLTMAMTSQILVWLQKHQQTFDEINPLGALPHQEVPELTQNTDQ